MSRKRQIESTEGSSTHVASKKTVKVMPMTFDEIAAIIQSGDSEKLKELIEEGRVIYINMRSSHDSLLMVACENGSIECARVLLDRRANINYTNYSGSVLKSACLSGKSNMLRFIIEQSVTMNDRVLSKLFDFKDIAANTEIATILVGYIQDVNRDINQEGIYDSFLYKACRAGNVTIARLLLERGALLGCRYSDPLVAASSNGHVEVVKLLLSWNTSTITNMPLSQERVKEALEHAANGGFVDVARCLVEYGASVKALNSALYEAVGRDHIEVTALLFNSGASISALLHAYDYSPWILACGRSSPGMIALLLDRGTDPNAVDARGVSPLKAALSHTRIVEVFMVLLAHGADPNQPLANGSTALLELAGSKQSEDTKQALAVLFEYGADPNLAHATTGQTALMSAALKALVDLVKLLLEHGADVTQVNREDQSVLDMLVDEKYGEVRELCTQYIDSNQPGAKQVLK